METNNQLQDVNTNPQVVQGTISNNFQGETLNDQSLQTENPNPQVEIVENEVIPDNVVTLSTGVKVQFFKLGKTRYSDLMIKAFSATSMDKKGNLVVDELNPAQQLNLAKNITEYHTALIDNGVKVYGDIEDYYELLNIDESWPKKVLRMGVIDADLYDLDDERDKEVLFLRFYAFNSDEDWRVLSENISTVE